MDHATSHYGRIAARPRKRVRIAAQIDVADADLLHKIAVARRTSIAAQIRHAVAAYLETR